MLSRQIRLSIFFQTPKRALASWLLLICFSIVFKNSARADIFYGADYVDGIIYKFDTSVGGGAGTAFANFKNPYRLTVSSGGDLFVAGPFTNVIERFDVFGNGTN